MMSNKNNNSSSSNCDDDCGEDSKIFPQRLMEILSDESYGDAICWLPHGKAFVIRNRDLFAESVMPKFFSRKAKFASFMRKLKRWNFSRVTKGPEMGAYYNEFFLQDKPQLVAQMFCQNARTKLAMATETQPAAVISQPLPTHSALPTPCAVPSSSVIHPSILAAMGKGQEDGVVKAAAPLLGVSNLQLLERQIHLLQQEYAERLYLQQQQQEQQIALQQQQMAQQQHLLQQQHFKQEASSIAQQQAMMRRMSHFMDLRTSQRQGLAPNSGRASAA